MQIEQRQNALSRCACSCTEPQQTWHVITLSSHSLNSLLAQDLCSQRVTLRPEVVSPLANQGHGPVICQTHIQYIQCMYNNIRYRHIQKTNCAERRQTHFHTCIWEYLHDQAIGGTILIQEMRNNVPCRITVHICPLDQLEEENNKVSCMGN